MIDGIFCIFVLFLYIVHLTAAFIYSLEHYFVACTCISLTSLLTTMFYTRTKVSVFSQTLNLPFQYLTYSKCDPTNCSNLCSLWSASLSCSQLTLQPKYMKLTTISKIWLSDRSLFDLTGFWSIKAMIWVSYVEKVWLPYLYNWFERSTDPCNSFLESFLNTGLA